MKRLLILMLAILFSMSFISSGGTLIGGRPSLIPQIDIPDLAGATWDNQAYLTKDNPNEYGTIDIKNTFLHMFPEDTVESITLINNTDTCVEDCSAIKNITINTDTKLINDVRFIDLKTNKETEIPYQFYIQDGVNEVEVNDYGCIGEESEHCPIGIIGTHIEEQPNWIPYNFEVMPSGTYTVKLEGKTNYGQSVDWQIQSQGQWLSQWQTWVYTTIRTGFSTGWTTGGPGAGPEGWRIVTNMDFYLINVTRHTGETLDTVCLKDANLAVLNCTTVSGDTATFTNPQKLLAGLNYSIQINGTAGTNALTSTGWTMPSFLTEFNVTGAYDNDGALTINGRNWGLDNIGVAIEKISNVTLNSPNNNYISPLTNVIFNCSASINGATLKNISLWINGAINQTTELTGTTNETTWSTALTNLQSYNWTCSSTDSDYAIIFAPSNRTLSINVLGGNVTFNSTSYETETEHYSLNSSVITTASLIYNGTSYAATVSNNVASASITLGSNNIGNNSFYWNVNSGAFNSTTYYQYVNYTILALCNATYNTPYINYTFADQTNSSAVDATLTGTFLYYLGDGTVQKTLSYTSLARNASYAFCSYPTDRALYIKPNLIYGGGSAYPSKTYSPSSFTAYTNTTTNKTLQLLYTSDGSYITFQLINSARQALQGVLVNASTAASGLVDSGTTDASGIVVLFLNPSVQHTINAFLAGYPLYSSTLTPTQTPYTITLGTNTTTTIVNLGQGFTYSISPSQQTLGNRTSYTFAFTMSSSFYAMSSWGFNITNGSGSLIYSTTSTLPTGGSLSKALDTGDNKTFIFTGFYSTSNQTSIITITYPIADLSGTGFSILNFITDFSTYLVSGMFGLQKGFGLNLIIFFIIFITTGVISWKYGLYTATPVVWIIFIMTFLFDAILGLIDIGFRGLATAFMAIVVFAVMWKEATGY